MLRRTLSLMLALLMVVGMIPTSALATEETSPETAVEIIEETTEVIVETTEAVAEATEAVVETTEAVVETTEEAEEETEETTVSTEEATEPEEDSALAMAEAALAAARAATSGECGDNMTWEIAEDVLTISGSGEMDDFTLVSPSPWRIAEAPFSAIVVEEGVYSIGDYAFMGLEAVTEVTLPATGLTSVGAQAFSGMIGLDEIVFSSGLLAIGELAFSDSNAPTICLPASVAFIDESAFAYSLGKVVIEYEGTLEQWLDLYAGPVENLVINCSDETLDPSKLPYTGKCGENLTWSLDKETGVLTISGTGAMFDYNDSDNLAPWLGLDVSVTKIVMEDGVSSIGDFAFHGLSRIQKVTIPGSVKSIGDHAFENCSQLQTVTLEEGVETIGEYAFADCGILAKVSIPESVESIAPNAFYGSTGYLAVEYPGTQEQWEAIYTGGDLTVVPPTVPPVTSGSCGDDLSWNVSDDGVLTVSGSGDMENLGDNAPWSNPGVEIKALVIEEGVTGIADNAFAGLTGVTEVTLPESMEYIGAMAFASCDNLTTITFTGNAPVIADDAFSGVTADVNYPQTNETWNAGVRKDYGGDLTWNTPDTVDQGTTDNGMSWTLDELGELVITGSAEAIPEGAFENMTGLKKVTLPDSVTEIGDGAFSGCTNLEQLNLDNVTKLGKDCFKDCDKLYLIDLNGNAVAVKQQKTGLSYEIPAIMEATKDIRWSIVSDENKVADVDAQTGALYVSAPGSLTIQCLDAYTGAKSQLRMDSLYTALTILPQIAAEDLSSGLITQKMLDVNADEVTNEKRMAKYALYLDKQDVASATYKFTVSLRSTDSETDITNSKNLKWSSTNTKVASVKANSDGTATVTVAKKADGACVILVSAKDTGAEGMLSIYVRDYAPRLETTSFTLNTKLADSSVTAKLVSSYDCDIIPESVKLMDGETEAQQVKASWKNGVLTIRAAEPIAKNGTLKLTLVGAYTNNELSRANVPFQFPVKVVIKNTTPAITAKQAAKFNLFYTDSTAALTVTAKGAEVLDVKLADCDFALTKVDGEYILSFADPANVPPKPDAKGTLLVTVEGYTDPVEKAVTIGTTTTKPKVALTATSSVINTAVKSDPVTAFCVLDNTNGDMITRYVVGVDCPKDFADFTMQGLNTPEVWDDFVYLTLTGAAGGTATVKVQAPNWTQSISLKHKISVNTKLPTAKLSSSTLELNTVFAKKAADVSVALDQNNLVLKGFSAFTAAKASADADKITVTANGNTITAAFKNPSDLPKAGTYSYTAVPTLSDGTELKAVTVKVKVAAAEPTVKLSASTLKMNKSLTTEVGTVTAKVTKGDGLQLVGYAGDSWGSVEDWNAANRNFTMAFDAETGELSVDLKDTATAGKYTLNLYPQFSDGNETVTMSKAVKLTVQVYEGDPKVSVSNKGKLDTIVPDSSIVYTVSKISNALGRIDSVKLYGQDADKFEVTLGENAGKQTFTLTMKDGVTYNTKTTYKVGFLLSICGYEFEGPEKTFKVTQSKLKFTTPKAVSFFQSQTDELTATFQLTAPEGTKLTSRNIQLNMAKTPAAFIRSLGNGDIHAARYSEYRVAVDGDTVTVTFSVRNHGHLTAGKSFNVILDVTPEGNAENVAPTQVKLTVKSYK